MLQRRQICGILGKRKVMPVVTRDLLNKLKTGDMSAYNRIYDGYGLQLHNALREKCTDREVVSEAFRRAMDSLCRDLAEYSGEDVPQICVSDYAERALREVMPSMQNETDTIIAQKEKHIRSRSSWILLALLAVLAALWVIVGQAMRMELMPNLDLGYSWFHEKIAPWF